MPLNIAVVLLLGGGWAFGRLARRMALPGVLGMVVWGILMGRAFGDLLPPTLFAVAPFLTSFALIVILLRAGLGINRTTLAATGRTAGLMAFIPGIMEGAVLTPTFRLLFGFPWPVAALTAFMIAAVSPAVVVPSMLYLKDNGYGSANEVPTIILAGASVDDVVAIAVFTFFLQTAISGPADMTNAILAIPLSLILGVVPGLIGGYLLVRFFRRHYESIRATEKALIVLMLAVLLVQVGDWVHSASLLGVMTVGFILLEYEERVAHEIAAKLGKVWVIAEIILFVLIGISVDPAVAMGAGLRGALAIAVGIVARSVGVWLATIKSPLSPAERLFCVIAYVPKATVQAALGGVALSRGIAGGEEILALAVLAIVLTAPLGLIGINLLGPRLLPGGCGDPDAVTDEM
ncbi:MAG: cation:proton antiporter [Alkalispirochaeta sp.]